MSKIRSYRPARFETVKSFADLTVDCVTMWTLKSTLSHIGTTDCLGSSRTPESWSLWNQHADSYEGKGKTSRFPLLAQSKNGMPHLQAQRLKAGSSKFCMKPGSRWVISFRMHSTFFSQVGSRRDSKCLWSSVADIQLYQNTVTTRNACPPAAKRLTNALWHMPSMLAVTLVASLCMPTTQTWQ